jgi:hypothetical protein
MLNVSPYIQRVWLQRLEVSWDRINQNTLGGALRAPMFALIEKGTRLGAWDAKTRTISISVEHFAASTWAQVEETLRHEMAHQIVSELFEATTAQPHGPLFAKACMMLGISSEASARPTTEQQRVLVKVKKLMALSTSKNPHEAQAAMAAANRLLLRHNLETVGTLDQDQYASRWLGKPVGRLTLERKVVAGILRDHFFVRCLWIRSTRVSDDKPAIYLEVVGQKDNLDLAEYVHKYLLRTLDELWSGYRSRQRGTRELGRKERNQYRIGVLMGFREHLDGQQKVQQEQGLVWLGDPAVDELIDRRHGRLRKGRRSYYRLGKAHNDGRAAGRNVRIRPGLREQDARDRGRSLPPGK